MDNEELCFLPAIELARLVRSRELSPVEIVDALLTRIARLNPTLAAFITVTAERARAEAKAAEGRAVRNQFLSPLDGLPYTLKDLEPTAGVRTTFGSKWFEHHVPAEDGAVAARLRASGGILLGKTNTPHFGYKDMCDNLIGPPCRNPWKLDRTSGGSSGGAAAALATGLGPLAHGSDGAGSIRIPAALCGVVGFKPSFGRVPFHPNPDYWSARSHNGPMARTVRDAALMLTAVAGPDARDPLTIEAPPPTTSRRATVRLRVSGWLGAGISATQPSIPKYRRLRNARQSDSPTWAVPSTRRRYRGRIRETSIKSSGKSAWRAAISTA